MSDSLPPHGLQHTRLPSSSLFPRVCSNLCSLSQWCHPTISEFSKHLLSSYYMPGTGLSTGNSKIHKLLLSGTLTRKDWCLILTVCPILTLSHFILTKNWLSILKEINPEYSLEELILKLQYFDYLMRRVDSLKKTLMLGRIEGKRRGRQRMR